MKTILLLREEATRPTQLLQNARPAKVRLGNTEAVTGCNCDRWGHPYPGCVEHIVEPKGGASNFITSEKNEVKMEYLIVFSVVAIMTSFVWIIARCLRHA